jgi:EAL and modified HD-GYP domain-containing signal transduction protein
VCDEELATESVALDALALRWQLIAGRDRKPIGVRLELRRHEDPDGGDAARVPPPPLSALLDAVVRGFVADDTTPFPQGLVLLAPIDAPIDGAMAHWSAPRNVLLEIPATDLQDETRVRILFESRGQGVRQALRLAGAAATPERLRFFQYVVGPASAARWSAIPVLAVDAETLEQADAALAAGVHAVVGWPPGVPVAGQGRDLSPSQRAILELVRLIQADAEIRALEKVFEVEPMLAYLLLTLANSVAFRRGSPTASLRQAVLSIGYQRLVKWLVLLLAIASKDSRIAPLIFTTIVRGYCMEHLAHACGRSRTDADEAFIVGAFSLLDRITGRSMGALLAEVGLPQAVVDALVLRQGPYVPFLDMALSLESGDAQAHGAACASLSVGADAINRALLRALAAADAMLALI